MPAFSPSAWTNLLGSGQLITCDPRACNHEEQQDAGGQPVRWEVSTEKGAMSINKYFETRLEGGMIEVVYKPQQEIIIP